MTEPSTETLQDRIMNKARELTRVKSEIARIEEELSTAKKYAESIENHDLPDLLEEAEMKEFVDLQGRKFSLKERVFVNLKAASRPAFFDWCRKNGLAGIIKTKVEVPFAAGQDEKADELMKAISELGHIAGKETKVESSTLRATAKKRLNSGDDWPEDIAPTTVMNVVEMKVPKK